MCANIGSYATNNHYQVRTAIQTDLVTSNVKCDNYSEHCAITLQRQVFTKDMLQLAISTSMRSNVVFFPSESTTPLHSRAKLTESC